MTSQEPNEFVPDAKVRREFNVSRMTISRWDKDPAMADLGWPSAVDINGRKYRVRSGIESFKKNLLAHAAHQPRQRPGRPPGGERQRGSRHAR